MLILLYACWTGADNAFRPPALFFDATGIRTPCEFFARAETAEGMHNLLTCMGMPATGGSSAKIKALAGDALSRLADCAAALHPDRVMCPERWHNPDA